MVLRLPTNFCFGWESKKESVVPEPRSYIRMSELSQCRLRVYHKMCGDEEEVPKAEGVALKVGKALESVVVELLNEAGLETLYTHDELAVCVLEPERIGHPDGLILDEFTGKWDMLEIKTMKDDNWKQFERDGLEANPWFRGYRRQIRAYLMGLMHGTIDWKVDVDVDLPVREELASQEVVMSGQCLVVGFNKDNGNIHTTVELLNDNEYRIDSQYAEELAEFIEAGMEPPPDWDGTQTECYQCEYRHLCPAALAEETVQADADHPQAEHLYVLGAEQLDLTERAKDIEVRRSEIKSEVDAVIGIGGKARVRDLGFSLFQSSRKTVDKARLESDGVTIPMKEGDPFTTLRVTRRKES